MKRRALHIAFGAFALANLAHCSEPQTKTSITASIDADSDVRALAVEVEARIDTRQTSSGGWKLLRAETFDEAASATWPLTLRAGPVTDESLTYQLVATARDDKGAVLAQARARGTLAEVRSKGLHVLFESSCLRRSPLCTGGQTCSGGECVEATTTPPKPVATGENPVRGTDPRRMPELIGAVGDPCDTPTARACSDFGSRLPVTCVEGVWTADEQCAPTMRCDTSTGSCRPLAAECRGREAETAFCDAETMRVCNRDLTASQIRPCNENERCATAPDGVAGCECNPGFVLQDALCRQPSSCTKSNGGCDPRTTCSPKSGGRECGACPMGYDGMGDTGCIPRLAALSVAGGELTPAFSPGTTSYRVRVPLLAQTVRVSARGPADARLTIAGAMVPSGEWTSPLLAYGENPVDIALTTEFGASRTYELVIERTGEEVGVLEPPRTNMGQANSTVIEVQGDTLAVGAPRDNSAATGVDPAPTDSIVTNSGAVTVYVNNGGTWQRQAFLKPEVASVDALYGSAIELDGDTLAVGEVRYDAVLVERLPTRPGLVHLYTRKNGVWTRTGELASNDGPTSFLYGASLSIDGDTFAVGAPGEGGVGLAAGAVYIYARRNGAWVFQQKLRAAEPQTGAQFGSGVELDGDTLAVAASIQDRSAGAVHMFEREGGQWVHRQILQGEPVMDQTAFGWTMSLRGDRLVVGSPHYMRWRTDDPNRVIPSGSVYVYERSGNEWKRTAILKAPTPLMEDHFGSSVALGDGFMVIGACGDDSGGGGIADRRGAGQLVDSGAAYVFALGEAGWEATTFLKPSHAMRDDLFGMTVALTEGGFVVGALRGDARPAGAGASSAPTKDSGSAYVFR